MRIEKQKPFFISRVYKILQLCFTKKQGKLHILRAERTVPFVHIHTYSPILYQIYSCSLETSCKDRDPVS